MNGLKSMKCWHTGDENIECHLCGSVVSQTYYQGGLVLKREAGGIQAPRRPHHSREEETKRKQYSVQRPSLKRNPLRELPGNARYTIDCAVEQKGVTTKEAPISEDSSTPENPATLVFHQESSESDCMTPLLSQSSRPSMGETEDNPILIESESLSPPSDSEELSPHESIKETGSKSSERASQIIPLGSVEHSRIEFEVELFKTMCIGEKESRNYRSRNFNFPPGSTVNSGMRFILIDWLIEVVEEYRLSEETLFHSVNYVDRYLERNPNTPRAKLQLVGMAAIFIASKYQDITPPSSKQLADISANTYTKSEVIEMEQELLRALCFRLAPVTSSAFLSFFLQQFPIRDQLHYLPKYLLEMTLLDDRMGQYPPSLVASSALALSNHTLGITNCWPQLLGSITGYNIAELMPCMNDITVFWRNLIVPTQMHRALIEKYSNPKMCRVGCIAPPKGFTSPCFNE
ncbi:cyclin A1 L-like [Pelomyxa schiedti]|nr:cyclin A1 L-like [Pelomyxa schiedti]